MKKHHDQNPSSVHIALIDQGSEAFRQKMCKHFEASFVRNWTVIENKPERNPDRGTILFKEPLT
ncbi:MAG: hypothetical protein H0X43_05490 [Nitrosospira sp.]|nr:hypothetical protein [Nitrosospira sp.]